MLDSIPSISDREILQQRGAKNTVNPEQPYAYLVEPEKAANGLVVDVATVFLTNRECPFHCLMCDLWKNTTDFTVEPGAILRQIDFALDRLPSAQHIKLYNSGNFFDRKAIPKADYRAIAKRIQAFDHVVIENHPRLCGDDCLRFRDMLGDTTLEIAMGLETIHPQILPALNKQMTLVDYTSAVNFLRGEGIAVRSFILLGLPFVTPADGLTWALRSIEFAFEVGVTCCAVIPTRVGNGTLERLAAQEQFREPKLASLEEVMQAGLELANGRGRVFVDLWDLQRFSTCDSCLDARRERLHRMNLEQQSLPTITCSCEAD